MRQRSGRGTIPPFAPSGSGVSLHADLLDQARHLANREPRRPKQASLRRAVSAAYYALFHFLVDRASRFVVAGGTPARRRLRAALARSFDHRRMRDASDAFARDARRGWAGSIQEKVPEALKFIARAFVALQQARHEADYARMSGLRRSDVEALITRARAAIEAWPAVAGSPAAEAYLLALLLKTRG